MDGEKLDVRLSVLETQFSNCTSKLNDHTELLEKILSAVHGNGTPGLKTKTDLNEASIKRAWWAIGLIATAYLGVVCFVLKYY